MHDVPVQIEEVGEVEGRRDPVALDVRPHPFLRFVEDRVGDVVGVGLQDLAVEFELLNRAGRIVKTLGKPKLRLQRNERTCKEFLRITKEIQKAA